MIIHKIQKHAGIAGQFEVSALVEYEGEEPSTVRFVGSVYGGPVVMVSAGGHQVFVTDPSRFGSEFGVKWVEQFFQDLRDRELV